MKWLVSVALFLFTGIGISAAAESPDEPIKLRAFGVPGDYGVGPMEESARLIMHQFRTEFPWINPVSPVGLIIPGGARTMDMVPLMQIAGDIAPDVIYVNFRKSQTYIDMKLLHPLDRYIEQAAGATIPDGSAMPTADYLKALRQSPHWADFEQRLPELIWPVIRRHCPYGETCPERREWEVIPLKHHLHVYAFPREPLVMAMSFDRTLFAEHADEGVEQRTPRDWEELMRWAKILTNPDRNEYGIWVPLEEPGWTFLSFLYSAGGRVVEQDAEGNWHCVLNTDEAIEAAYFYARLRLEPVMRDGKMITRGVLQLSEPRSAAAARVGMTPEYLNDQFLGSAVDQTKGVGPVPRGPTGKRGSEFNAQMFGMFSGLRDDTRRRDAAWEYIRFYDGPQARCVRTEKMVEAGLGRFVRLKLLQACNVDGRYDSVLPQVSQEMMEIYEEAFQGGVPEPYGRNCDTVYDELKKPIGAMWNSSTIRDAIDRGDAAAAKAEIRGIFERATARINERLLGNLPPEKQRKRNLISWTAIIVVVVVFAWVLRRVIKAFTPEHEQHAGGWQIRKYARAYLIVAPALILIGLWMYWPMLRGTEIAFQDYSVVGDSRWVGARNFATVLFNPDFWQSLWVSLTYALLFMLFGFVSPIALAVLLNETPRGKVAFRTIYYLPAVLSGVVVIFLWKTFYAPSGMINQVINLGVVTLNWLPGVDLPLVQQDWLQNPTTALFACLLPTVWAGMGPGCLIYLAAFKTIPEDIYDAADIDGAGVWSKLTRVALPSIKALVMINFIGAMIGAVRGSGGFILAMTGGGPYSETGGATEVIGLKLFYTTFGQLQFGTGAAMAWVLGSLLIGFTVLQLKRLSRLEFKTTEKV